MEIVVSRRVCDDPKSWSFCIHWYEQVFWYLNSWLPMWIGRAIAYFNPKLPALVWVYQWFFYPVSKPQSLSKLQYYQRPWINCRISNNCEYRYIHMFCIFWEEWRHGVLLWSEWYWSKVGSKTMGISMIVHFSGRFPPNNLVLFCMHFINYPKVSYIDVKYRPLYIFLREKVW